ncbi:MAG TPA: aminoacyl-histidine dipeptidase [Candidatus Krumholzibacteria bacterium]|nr:aminoacyl-histidine dipeptidase [Candidatus Krumholzibacteria bacterium]
MSAIEKLQPRSVWGIFAAMSAIPRGSGNEAAVQAMFKTWADQRGLAWKEDAVGNLLITIPASKGMEKAPPVLVQGHVDMVCEKNSGTKHDFAKDPIKLQVNGDWVTAEGTTLGADNGIGVAMGLAVAEEKGLKHPTVEVLLTVDEERGLTGAAGVQKGFFTAKRMINLDSEEDAALFIGCSGGQDTILTVKNKKVPLGQGLAGRKVTVKGLLGGHSGLDIHKNRGNAIKILTRCLLAAKEQVDFRLVSIDGGSMRNAIPREAEARVAVKDADGRLFKKLVDAEAKRILTEELHGIDDGCQVKVGAAKVEHTLGGNCTLRTLHLLDALPNGVLAMSRALPDLVETSSNVGVVKTDGAQVRIVCCSRSSNGSALAGLARRHRSLGAMLADRCDVIQEGGYPGWQPNPDSKLVKATADRYAKVFKRRPELKAIHAGLECGLLTEKYPDLDIVSFGPDITGAHSPDEQVNVPSVQRVFKLFTALLADLG